MAERLNFGSNEMPYDAVAAAEHLARYSLLRPICKGKRVLDVACGEGYGSRLLSEWGAASIFGIDVSSEAIDKARQIFHASNVTYIVGDACRLPEASLGGEFDIICSFETIEHVDQPEALLRSIAALMSPECVVLISAPNDTILPEGSENPYHKRHFDLPGFKSLTESVLGPATTWMLGTPLQGFVLLPESDELSTDDDADMREGLRLQPYGNLTLLPPKGNQSPSRENVAFWVGVWGNASLPIAVAAPQSMTSWQDPWRAIEYFKREIAGKDAECRRLQIVLAEERRRITELQTALADERRITVASLQHYTPPDPKLSPETIHAIAREVWFERQRWGLPYKIGKWFARTFARRTS